MVPEPPSQEAAAVIAALSVSEGDLRTTGKDVILRGIVTRLSLADNTGQVVATIIVGNQPFSVALTTQQKQVRTIFPGKNILIRYSLEQVKWI